MCSHTHTHTHTHIYIYILQDDTRSLQNQVNRRALRKPTSERTPSSTKLNLGNPTYALTYLIESANPMAANLTFKTAEHIKTRPPRCELILYASCKERKKKINKSKNNVITKYQFTGQTD